MSTPTSCASARGSGCRWDFPAERLELQRDEVHLWRVDVGGRDALSAPASMLTPDELAKAGRFRFDLHRTRYLVAHLALRSLLATYPETSPRGASPECGPCGGTGRAPGTPRFSISRSHDLAVLAIGRAGGLGVDIEQVRPGIESDLASCISPAARRLLEALPPSARTLAVFQAWTRLEAWAKASGEGLDAGLAAFEQFLAPRTATLVPSSGDASRRWWLHDFSPGAGYVGALAVAPGVRRFRLWQWRPGDAANATRRPLSPTRLASDPSDLKVQHADLSS
jgi:4'-phosphopantetheinyl transferase